MEDTFWMPSPDDLRQQAKINRQGSIEEAIPEPANSKVIAQYSKNIETTFKHYHEWIDKGVAREVARANLPLSTYTEWYWKMDLHNLLHFLQLRLDAHAQKEIRVYAEAIAEFVKQKCPFTWEAFVEHRLNAAIFSDSEMQVLRETIRKGKLVDRLIEQRKSQLKKGEASDALVEVELAELRAKLTGEKLE